MKNYTQVYVKNSFEAAETYCKAFGAEITREFINMEYVGGFQFDNIQFVGKISVCRRQMCLDGSEMLLVDEVDNKEF